MQSWDWWDSRRQGWLLNLFVTSNLFGYYCCCFVLFSLVVVIIIILVGENRPGNWELECLGSVTFSLLVEFYQQILLIISHQVNHCDLSTVKDMWVMMRTLEFIASWLTKVFSKLSKGKLLFGRYRILSHTWKHCGVFKLLLASWGIFEVFSKNVTCC